ncbi:MAG TPA: hypothetical protein VH500_09175 [Nitrososphaeraceae archaeon]|jgi:hypothetical protein
MDARMIFCKIGTPSVYSCSVIALFFLIILCVTTSGPKRVYGISSFSESDKPFGISYDDWVSKFFNWDFSLNDREFKPQIDGCLYNNAGSMVMLMNTVEDSAPLQKCKISSQQGIMIPLWVAWCDNKNDLPKLRNPNALGVALDQQLTECSRLYNLGNIKSNVIVDGIPVAKLDITQSLIPGSGNKIYYKINSMKNVTELYSKGFNATLANDTHQSSNIPGPVRAGSQGWWVFLKPFPVGSHSVVYDILVTPTGAMTSPGTNVHAATIPYTIQVSNPK